MKKISELLGRFTVIAQNGEVTRQAVCDALKEVGINTTTKELTVKGNLVILKAGPSKKSEVFLKQAKLLEALKRNPLTKNIIKVC